MSAPDLAAEAAQLREIVAGLAADVTGLIETVRKLATAVTATDWVSDALASARRAGYLEALAEHGAYRATAHAQQARSALRVLPGVSAAKQGGGAA